MQPIIQFEKTLRNLSSPEHFIYSKYDLRNIFPNITDSNLNMILSRACSKEILERVCKGVYIFDFANFGKPNVLYHVAAKLRSDCFNYISLETVLCETSYISQQMISYLTVMTSGRSGIIDCGKFGTIEFVHTAKKIERISKNLFLDTKSKMLKAKPVQAYKDMIDAKRTTIELISNEAKKELSYE
ncbi:hypothetical protein [uncultured Treponema sp.]|uniref:type IV toxin-antitoxin system AbiEi family antitoxin n=1 Tax=Treponema sp. UBA3813 TaxID=1947715 RepID=UPI0025E7C732|nr:hypothetical protein [uncultured Treponema sp.]